MYAAPAPTCGACVRLYNVVVACVGGSGCTGADDPYIISSSLTRSFLLGLRERSAFAAPPAEAPETCDESRELKSMVKSKNPFLGDVLTGCSTSRGQYARCSPRPIDVPRSTHG